MIVAARAMHMAIARARELGVGIVTTTYHDHVGSSGKYVRMALREDLIGISLSSRSAAPSYAHDSIIHGSIQGSPPLAFGFPAGAGRLCFLLDLASHTPWDEQCFRKMPQVFVKAIGMSHVANILSGTLGGQMLPEFDRGQTQFRGADHRGSTRLSTWSGSRLWRPLRRIWTSSMEETSNMQPLPGFSASSFPGGRAWQKESDYQRTGIPISADAMTSLARLADELKLSIPCKNRPFRV